MLNFMGEPELAEAYKALRDEEKMELHKEKLFQFYKHLMDGSKSYIGCPVKEVHGKLGISNELFDVAGGKILDALKKVRPRPAVMKEVFKRTSELRPKICSEPKKKPEEIVTP